MKNKKTLFLDIGGVLLTNGWDRSIRTTALSEFNLDPKEFDLLHKEFYDLHEQGKLSLSDYLDKVIFYKKRDFSKMDFEKFMKEQSQPYPEMLQYFSEVKKNNPVSIFSLSNEGRELAEYRIQTFNLKSFIDTFIVSCFVGFQKPNPRIYEMALDLSQADLKETLYIDDRAYLVEAAGLFGIRGIVHTSLKETKKEVDLFLKP